ncbi:uncharacterized abhydrolase domain-containing protein DDB_G0269086-like isoform X1 [Hoplias malabaricus]|uniref:uncharacterized abhydrolase domain-containing protein DDB_G0269086-like isoform X1 n=2 Tax=Hoplias malabaricus TaxID=27720 RepID=UPI0034636096
MEIDRVKLEYKRSLIIPVGRQLHRTPPSKSQSFRNEDNGGTEKVIKAEADTTEDSAPSRMEGVLSPAVKEERKSFRRSSITSASAQMGDADPEAFIQGMQGYEWTDADLEFVHQAKQQRKVQQLKQELTELLKTLKAETQRLELAAASRDKLRSDLSKTLSCELMMGLCREVLLHSSSPTELEGLEDKSLLAKLKLKDIQSVIHEETLEVQRLERELAKAQEIRDKEEHVMKELQECQKHINRIKVNIQAMKTQLSELKAQLSEKEEASRAAPQKRRTRNATWAHARGHKPTRAAKAKADPGDFTHVVMNEKIPKEKDFTTVAHKKKFQKEKAPKMKDPGEKAPKMKDPGEKAPKMKDPGEKAPKMKDPGEKAPKMKDPGEKAPKKKAQKDTAPKEMDLANGATKGPKEKPSKKEKFPSMEKALEEYNLVKVPPDEPTEQNLQPSELSAKASRASVKPRKGTKPTSASLSAVPQDSETGVLRRSKRIATKSQSKSETAAQKTSIRKR